MKRCFLVVWIAMIGSAAMLNAAVEKPLEKISPLGGWKQTAPGRFEIRHEGTHVAHLMAEATVEPKSYYRISWKAEAGKDWKTLEPNAMIQVGKSEYIAWNPSEKSAPRSVCFYSGDGGKLKCSLYLPRKSTGTLAVEQLKLEKLEEKDLHDNLIRNGDFEAENTLPGEWRKSWKQKKNGGIHCAGTQFSCRETVALSSSGGEERHCGSQLSPDSDPAGEDIHSLLLGERRGKSEIPRRCGSAEPG